MKVGMPMILMLLIVGESAKLGPFQYGPVPDLLTCGRLPAGRALTPGSYPTMAVGLASRTPSVR
jgi:hypothetical protein